MSSIVQQHVDEINAACKLSWKERQQRLEEIITNIYRVNAGDAHGACEKVWTHQCDAMDHEDRESKRSEGIEIACEMCATAAHRRVLRDVPDWP